MGQQRGPQSPFLCALTAACYDNQVRELGLNLPELWSPEEEFAMADCEPDGVRVVWREGRIYLPEAARGARY